MRNLMSFKKFLDEGAPNIFFKATREFMGEDLSNKQIKTKLKELERKLKSWDWSYVWSDDSRSYKRGKQQEDEIKKLKNEIGAEGEKMWMKFLKDKGLREANGGGIDEYQRFVCYKMKHHGIKNIDDLTKEQKKDFWKMIDDEWGKTIGNDDVEVNMPEQKNRSMFPEMDSVVRKGLGYGDGDRKVGERSVTGHSFCDAGNLYPEDRFPKFIHPSEQNKKMRSR